MDNKKNKTSKAWINRQLNDVYVNMAQKAGYRSRAAYKLLEIDDEVNLFKNVQVVVDLGCSPGSWSQVACSKVGANSLVIGVDLLEMAQIINHHFIQGDFTNEITLNQLIDSLNGRDVDLIISDMAPNLTGIKGIDQARSAYLVELVLDFAANYLKVDGNCLIKVFQGNEFNNLVKQAKSIFRQVIIKKPKASRSESSETYLLCKNKYI